MAQDASQTPEFEDYSADIERPAVAQMDLLQTHLDDLARAEARAAEVALEATALANQIKDLKEHKIPQVMGEMNLKKLTIADGREIEVSTELRVSLPKEDRERRAQCISWLDNNDYGAIVSRKIVITFDKASEARAKFVEKRLAKYKDPLPMETLLDVNHQSLGKLARDRQKEGKTMPDIFRPFFQTVAKVTRPKT